MAAKNQPFPDQFSVSANAGIIKNISVINIITITTEENTLIFLISCFI